MAYRTLRELREELNDEQIKNILAQFNVEPRTETDAFMIFPTCCHNLEGGSPKLYYYKNTKLFKCYTECNEMFDIFRLLVKMMHLRGKEITLRQAVEICDLDSSQNIDFNYSDIQDFKYMQELMHSTSVSDLPPLKTYDIMTLNRYTFDLNGLTSWIEEGISISELQRFNIKYDPIENCIVIPNFDINGHLIGVRGRFLNIDAKAKYAPLWYNNVCLSHPTGRNFYGIYENKEAIQTLIERSMKKGFYEGINIEKNYCEECGEQFSDNIAICPKCGSKEVTQINRVCGYLGFSKVNGDTRMNEGKLKEIEERVSM